MKNNNICICSLLIEFEKFYIFIPQDNEEKDEEKG